MLWSGQNEWPLLDAAMRAARFFGAVGTSFSFRSSDWFTCAQAHTYSERHDIFIILRGSLLAVPGLTFN